jgi:hypothetical protein
MVIVFELVGCGIYGKWLVTFLYLVDVERALSNVYNGWRVGCLWVLATSCVLGNCAKMIFQSPPLYRSKTKLLICKIKAHKTDKHVLL